MNILAILIAPLLSAAFCCLPLKRLWASFFTVVSSFIVCILAVHLAWLTSEGKFDASNMPSWMVKWISTDGLSVLIVLLIAAIGVTASLFSIGYMAHGNLTEKRLRLFYVNYNLFFFSMLAIPLMTDLTFLWVAVELTTLCSALLVSIENTNEALEAAWKYVLLSLMGAGIALFGFLLLFAAMQTAGGDAFTWQGLTDVASNMPSALVKLSFVMILIGLGAKVGLVPMHTWLPDAHSQAPSPVCALLSGIETSAILYAILRLFPIVRAVPDSNAGTLAVTMGLISVGTASLLLFRVRDFKRMFAFSTVEHMGIILTAVGLGAFDASYGAVLQIVTHSLTKSFCFFAAGAVLLAAGTREIAQVRNLLNRSPAASAALVFGGLAITGAPPLAVFLSEFSILRAGLTQEQYLATGLLALFIGTAFFAVMGHINKMVFVRDDGYEKLSQKEPVHLPFSCRFVLILAAIPILVLGFYIPEPLHHLIGKAAQVLHLEKTKQEVGQ